MSDDTAGGASSRAMGKPGRRPPTIDLAREILEETAPLAGGAHAERAPADPSPEPAATEGAPAAAANAPAGPAARKPERRTRTGLGGLALAGLLGGLVGAAVAVFWPLAVAPADDRLDRLDAWRRAVDQGLAGAAGRAEVQALVQRVTDLGNELKAAGGRLDAVGAKADDTADRLAKLPTPRSAPGIDPTVLAAVTARLGSVEAAVKAFDPSAARAAAQASDAAAQASGTAAQASDKAAQAADQATQTAERTAALQSRIATLEALERKPAEPRMNRLARIVLAGQLLRAIEDGRPYAVELAALKDAGVAAASLAPLEREAASGLATAAALSRDFAGLAEAFTAEPAAPDEGVFERLTRSARQLVRVRPVDGTGGTDAAAVGARIATALARGDLAAAARDWNSLPQPARAKAGGFGDRLDARLAAEAIARTLLDEAPAGLGAREDEVHSR